MPSETSSKNTIEKIERYTELLVARDAVNQLISLVAGARFARKTERLKIDNLSRVDKCISLVMEEYKAAMYNDDLKAEQQANRKLASFKSLRVLSLLIATLIKEHDETPIAISYGKNKHNARPSLHY
tara:strand:+ start:489 stop:869 length:381 start_codon:yes stop_codon:yes gene_type:complete